jgi:periplasmic protein TonB
MYDRLAGEGILSKWERQATMNWPRSLAFLLSVAIHAAVLLFLVSRSGFVVLQEGKGRDDLTVVVTVTLENGDLAGLDSRNERASRAAAAITPDKELARPEKNIPEAVTKPVTEEPPLVSGPTKADQTPQPAPLDAKPREEDERPSKEVSAETRVQPEPFPRPAADAQEEQQQASRAFEGRRTHLASLYQSKIFMALVRHRINPHSGHSGRVVVLATIAPSGELISRNVAESSGSDILDKAALTTLDNSAPFPAIPHELGPDPMTLRVPFEYSR